MAQIDKEFVREGLSCVCVKSDGLAQDWALLAEEAEERNNFYIKIKKTKEK